MAAQAIDFAGLVQTGAIDQPQIYMLLRNSPTGTPITGQTTDPLDPFGTVPTIGIQAYLDTGASGILVSTPTAGAWGLSNSTYNGQTVTFNDIGVAGTAAFNVSQPIYAAVAPFTPTSNTEDVSTYVPVTSSGNPLPLRLEIGPADTGDNSLSGNLDDDFLEDIDVVGMSALAGKRVVVDARTSNQAVAAIAKANGDLDTLLNNIDNLSLHTYVYDPSGPNPVPGTSTTNLHVKLSYADFTGFTTTLPTGAPGPTLAHNPFIGPSPLAVPNTDHTPAVTVGYTVTDPTTHQPQQLTAKGSFLLDTGAGASFISDNIAAQLHVRYVPGTENSDSPQLETFVPTPDPNDSPTAGTSIAPITDQFQLSVGGIGGSATVAGFYLDSLLIPTMEGNAANLNDPRHLHYTSDPTNGGLGPPVLVTNITLQNGSQTLTLDGDLGMNFLVGGLDLSGADIDSLSFGNFTPGAFDWLTFDEASGVLGLQLNSAFHIPGDFNFDGKLDAGDISAMMQALANLKQFESDHGLTDAQLMALADLDGSGTFSNADLQSLISLLADGSNGSGSLTAVPEPGSVVLFGIGVAALAVITRRGRRG